MYVYIYYNKLIYIFTDFINLCYMMIVVYYKYEMIIK